MDNNEILEHSARVRQNILKSVSGDRASILFEETAESDFIKTEVQDITKAERLYISKGGKAAFIGEKRTFGGREYIKTAEGWKFHGKGTGAKAKERTAKPEVSKTAARSKNPLSAGEKYEAQNSAGEKVKVLAFDDGSVKADGHNLFGSTDDAWSWLKDKGFDRVEKVEKPMYAKETLQGYLRGTNLNSYVKTPEEFPEGGRYTTPKTVKIELSGELSPLFKDISLKYAFAEDEKGIHLNLEYHYTHHDGGSNGVDASVVFTKDGSVEFTKDSM